MIEEKHCGLFALTKVDTKEEYEQVLKECFDEEEITKIPYTFEEVKGKWFGWDGNSVNDYIDPCDHSCETCQPGPL